LTIYLVLDTSAILRISGVSSLKDFFSKDFRDTTFTTTLSVVKEMKRTSSKLYFEMFRDDISILEPDEKYIKYVKKKLRYFGGDLLLSKTDIELLALAYQLSTKGEVVVVSEDKHLQNVASYFGFRIYSVTGGSIRKVFKVVKRCLNCGRIYDFAFNNCPDCGSVEFELKKQFVRVTKNPST